METARTRMSINAAVFIDGSSVGLEHKYFLALKLFLNRRRRSKLLHSDRVMLHACYLALLLRESLYSRKAAPNEAPPNPANTTVVTSNIFFFHLWNIPLASTSRLINLVGIPAKKQQSRKQINQITNKGFLGGPGRIRTGDQQVMSLAL